jgi:hypothetical protein
MAEENWTCARARSIDQRRSGFFAGKEFGRSRPQAARASRIIEAGIHRATKLPGYMM